MSSLEEVLADALKAQNGFQRADGTFYMGSSGVVSVEKLVEAVAKSKLAVVPWSVFEQLRGIANDVRAEITDNRKGGGDVEQRAYLNGELQGILSAHDVVLDSIGAVSR